jgi:hypothetical protein
MHKGRQLTNHCLQAFYWFFMQKTTGRKYLNMGWLAPPHEALFFIHARCDLISKKAFYRPQNAIDRFYVSATMHKG